MKITHAEFRKQWSKINSPPPSFYFSIGGVSWGWPVSKFAQSGKGIIDLFD